MARCERPFYHKGIPCPCGKCDFCRKRRASGWGFRISQEADSLGSAYFVTLTYSPEHVPKQYQKKEIYRDSNGKKKTKYSWVQTKRLTVDIYHLQKFIKRLRQDHKGAPIKYYGVSEYGDETFRPHYHVILLGVDLLRLVGVDNFNKIQRGAIKLKGEDEIHIKTWPYGHITIGTANTQTVNYTLKYISKGRKIPQYQGDDRQKERSLMSKGMGLAYLTEHNKKMHNSNLNRQYVVTNELIKIALPRYLKERLYDSLERQFVAEQMAQDELKKRLDMGQIERERYERSLRKNTDEVGQKPTYNHKGKL